jgi:hypothetical protein
VSRQKRTCPPGALTTFFVEGGDEEKACLALLGGPAGAFWMTLDGQAGVAVNVASATKDPGWPGIQNIGVVLDAGENLADARTLAESVFVQLGRGTPSRPGVVEADTIGKIGYFLLPDNAANGALESLLKRSADPAVRACVDGLFVCTPNVGSTTAQRDKAWLSAYLAAKSGKGRLDQAWPALDPAHPCFDPLRTFLQALL